MRRSLLALGTLVFVFSPAIAAKNSSSPVGDRHLRAQQSEDTCVLPDNGSGTVYLPPEGCEYLSPAEVHMIIDGLPSGTTIELDPIHSNFFNITRTPGGTMAGEIEEFDSVLLLHATGTGTLSDFDTFFEVMVSCEVHI